MKRLLRLRLSLLLFGLAALPVLALPFAEQLRTQWKRYWEPRPEVTSPIAYCGFDEFLIATEDPVVVWDEDEPQGCGLSVDLAEVAKRDDLEFAESMAFGSLDAPANDSARTISEDHRRRFLEELADTRYVLTSPSDPASSEATDETHTPASLPRVDP